MLALAAMSGRLAVTACGLALVFGLGAHATSLTWDNNGATAPNPQDGAGNWDTTTANWWNAGNTTWSNATPDSAIFGSSGTGGAVTLTAGGITANTITFNSFLGTYTLQTGPLKLNGGLTVNSGANAVTITSTVSGAGGMTLGMGASGVTILSGASSTFTGGVSLTGGTLRLGANSNGNASIPYPAAAVAGPLGTGTLTIASGTTLTSDGITARVIANAVTLNGSPTLGAAATYTGTLTFANQVTLGADVTPTYNVATTFGGLAWNAARAFTDSSGSTAVTIHGWLSGGANTLTLQGTGTGLVFGDATAPVFGTGNLQIGTASSAFSVKNMLNTNVIKGDLNLPNFAGNQLDLNTFNFTIGSLSGGGSAGGVVTTVAAGTSTLVIAGASGSATFDGVISGTGVKLIKTGGSTQTLTRNPTFTGATSVYAGTLALSNAATLTNSVGTYLVAGGTLSLDNNSGGAMVNRLTDASAITLGSLTLTGVNGGGGAMVETVGALTLSYPGTITVNNGSTVGDKTTLAFGAVTRNVGSAVNFVGSNGTLGGGANSPNVTSTGAWVGASNGILPWGTVGGTSWAADNANSIRAYAGAFNAVGGLNPTQNAQTTGSLALGGNATANSLNLITSGAGQSLALGSNTLGLTSGGILKTGTDAYTISGSAANAISGSSGTELIAHVFGGDLTISAPLNTAIAIITQGGTGKLILSGTRAASLTNIGIAGTLELDGASTTVSSAIVGPGALIANLNSGQMLTLSYGASTFVGGLTLGANTSLTIGNNTTLVGGAITGGPLGLGPLTIGGGANTVIRTEAAARTIYNDLVINGDFTFSAISGAGSLTVDPQSRGDFGSIQVNGARTINAVANTLTLNGPIIGSGSPSLVLKGAGTVTLQNNSATPSTFGNLTIGDPYQPTGALGGNVIVNSQNALGSGAVTINYGGSLNLGNGSGTSPFSPASNITVNAGGSVQYRYNLDTTITPTGLLTLGNLASVAWNDTQLNTYSFYSYTLGSTLTGLPTAGAISFNGSNYYGNTMLQVNIAGAYPSLTGTLVLGGHNSPGDVRNSNKIVFSGVTTLSSVDDAARTLVFNDQGGRSERNGVLLILGGVALNADLTVKGSGNAGLAAASYPIGLGSELGSLTAGTNGNHALTVAMSPVGIATVAGPALGNPGVNAVTVRSGWLGVDAGNGATSGKVFASALLPDLTSGITLNGGGIEVSGGTYGNQPTVTISDNISIGANGGTIMSSANNSANAFVTLSGQLKGSGPLTLMAGRQQTGNVSNNNGSTLTLSGDNSGYTGNITLARTGAWGGVLFSGLNSSGTGNTVTAPNGTGFGFNSLATAVALLPKFITGRETVLDVANLTGATINLSSGGTNPLNFSGRLGNYFASVANPTFSNPIIPYDATGYRFAGAAGTITFSTANIMTGAYPVDFSHVANAPGQINSITSSLYSITAAQNFTGAFTMDGNGPAATAFNATMMVNDNIFASPGYFVTTLGAGGDFSSASSVSLNNIAQLALSGTTGKISSTAGGTGLPVTVQGGGVLVIGDTAVANNDGAGGVNRLGGSTAKLTLGGTYGGGILQIAYGSTGSPSQMLGSLTIGTGASAISTLNAAGGVSLGLTVANGTITRSAYGSTLYLPFPTTQFTGVTLTGAASTGGLAVNGWMYVPTTTGNVTGANFAAVNGSNQLVAIAPTINNINTANADFVNSAGGTYALSASNTVNTLTLNTATAVALGTNVLTVAKGGIIANITGAVISGSGAGGLTSGFNHELIVNSAAAGTFTISAPILQDSGGNNIDLTKLGGASTITNALILSSGNNQLGNVWISGGSVRVQTSVGSLGVGSTSGSTITLEGGALYIDLAAGSNTFNQALRVMPRGYYSSSQATIEANTIQQVTAGQITTFTGPLALNAPLTVPAVAGTTLVLNGAITGAGGLINGTGSAATRATLVLGGNNSGFSGGVAVYPGAHLRLENTAAAGTGTIIGQTTTSITSQNPTLYFGTGAAGISLANDVVNLQTLVNWNTGSSLTAAGTVETFTGAMATTTGLTFQGNAASTSAISETVLAGAVSVNGLPQAYNWSTTPTTSIQNFVNGQGGINSGVTSYSGFTLLNNNTATASALAIDAPGVSGTIFGNGALGLVRFGGANSFLPGSAGPGYIAALAKAGAGSDSLFGYLLSGGAVNGGSTYIMPEGKGFVIGSLGSGTQVAGVLGVTGGTATLLGGPKAAAGQLLTGFNGGDINIHANGATDTQALNLLARAASDALVLGNGVAANNVVFTPTYGDSGATSAITLLAKRTGTTTLNKIGLGTVEFNGVAFTNTDDTDARSSGVTINVNAGTLKYTQVDSSASANYSVNVNSGGTLTGTGKIGGSVTANSGSFVAPGASLGTLTIDGNYAQQSNATLLIELAGHNQGSTYDWLNVTGPATLAGLLSVSAVTSPWFLDYGDTFTVVTASSINSTGLTLGGPNANWFSMNNVDGNKIVLTSLIPEPGMLSLLALGALALLRRRR